MPTVVSTTPSSVTEGSEDFTLTVNGNDFVEASIVRWNGQDRPTTFASQTQLSATIATEAVSQEGSVEITVFNPAPGGGSSNAVALEIAPRVNPRPNLVAIDPTVLEAGTDAAAVRLVGDGFIPQSFVFLDGTHPTTEYVSPTELRMLLTSEDLAAARIAVVSVINSVPGGGISSARELTINSPVPSITSLTPQQIEAGQGSYELHINGTGFIGNSSVLFEGSPRETRWISSTELAATLEADDLAETGEFNLTVVNPEPGGGTSAAAILSLINGIPVLETLPSRGATAGRSGFTLTVHGRFFVKSSVVRWNGTDRPTTYVSPNRLLTEISSGDVAAAGTADVTVHNPTPGGGVSEAIAVTIRAFEAPSITDLKTLDLPARDLVYDPGTNRLFASIPGSVAVLGNVIVAIDPATAEITDTVFVGSEPGSLERSDDGSILWVALDGSGEVRRIDLGSLTAGPTFSLAARRVEQMRVMPGRSGTLAIALRNTCCSPGHEGVAIYDDGVARSLMTPGHTGSNTIAFGSDSTLYGYNNETTEFGFRTMKVSPAGVEVESVNRGLMSGPYARIEHAGGRVYATNGAIIDPGRGERVGTFTDGGVAVLPDVTLGRAFYLDAGTITAYDLNTLQPLGSVFIDDVATEHPAGSRARLIRWGTDGLAFRDGVRIYLLRSTMAEP